MSKSYLQSTTAAVASATRFDPVNPSLRRQLTIYLLFFVVLTSFLTISGCAGTAQISPSSTLSALPLVDGTRSSPARSEAPSTAIPQDYTYRAGKITVPPVSSVGDQPSGPVSTDPNRTVRLSGEVNIGILAKANQLYALSAESTAPIDIYIDSPGGSVRAGLHFIAAMRAAQDKNIVIRCHVERFAASMAFTIFTQCNERNALPYALLLFHAPRISGEFTITPQVAVELVLGLARVEEELLDLIMPVMGITLATHDWFGEAYLSDRLFTALELSSENPYKWFNVVSKIGAGQ